MKKTILLIILAAALAAAFPAAASRAAGPPPFAPGSPGPGEGIVPSPLPLPDTVSHGIRTIAVDAGHGGKEPGAVGRSGTLEKDLTLALAERVGKALSAAGYQVVYTREGDYFVGLRERTAIANAAGVDLFLSVHGNASSVAGINGFETYYVSFAPSDSEAQALAKKENASIENSGPVGGVTAPALEAILWDMAQTESVNQSGEFAARLQRRMVEGDLGKSRGTRQAPLIVLLGARMPAVLVETGYISNAEEELRLKGEAFGERFAQAVVQAVNEESQALLASCAPATASSRAAEGPAVEGEAALQ